MARSSTRGPGPKIISRESLRRGSPVQFLQETISELRKSVWPTREETVRLSYIVILLASAVGFILGLLDFVLGKTFGEYIIR